MGKAQEFFLREVNLFCMMLSVECKTLCISQNIGNFIAQKVNLMYANLKNILWASTSQNGPQSMTKQSNCTTVI